TIYLALFGWVIGLFDKASQVLLRAVGIEPVQDKEHSATARDLEHIVAESGETGELSPELSRLLDRMLDFPGQTAEHAMIPRSRTDVVRAEDTVSAVLSKMASGHTRYPVVARTPTTSSVWWTSTICSRSTTTSRPISSRCRTGCAPRSRYRRPCRCRRWRLA